MGADQQHAFLIPRQIEGLIQRPETDRRQRQFQLKGPVMAKDGVSIGGIDLVVRRPKPELRLR
jgi:hypothetical protein